MPEKLPLTPESADRAARSLSRAHLLNRLWAEDSPHAAKLEKCGAELVLRCGTCGAPRRVGKRCDLKWCPSCQHALASRTVARYQAACAAIKWPLFVTFTTKNHDTITGAVRAVRRAFGKLRRLRWWRAAVRGGVAGVEVTNKGRGFHVHVHALIDCRWLAVRESPPGPLCKGDAFKRKAKAACTEVAEQWTLCMDGRPSSVKPRRVWTRDGGDIRAALAEVLKYAITTEDMDTIEEPVTPLLDEISRTRMVTSWGSCYGLGGGRPQRPKCECLSCRDTPTWVPDDIWQAAKIDRQRNRK